MRLGAITDLLHSEKAIVLGLLVIAMTVFVFTGHATLDQWKEHTTWMAGFYVAGKTTQGIFSRKPDPEHPPNPADPSGSAPESPDEEEDGDDESEED